MSQISLLQPSRFPTSAEMTWRHLEGSSSALAISQLYRQHQTPLLLITADAPSAYRFQAELQFFLPEFAKRKSNYCQTGKRLHTIIVSPHQDIISERLRVLAQLPQQQHGILIVALNTLMHRVAPAEFITGHSLHLEKGQRVVHDSLRLQLEKSRLSPM